jgi:deazaflavin-dependent oxidoreductase (nitroreductase family)
MPDSESESASTYVKPDITLYGQDHVDKYRATDGAVGHEWNGTQCLILTTTGRKSGQKHDSPMIYGTYGDSVTVVASYGGAPQHPAWYLNLEADPHVEVQVLADRYQATARTAEGEERQTIWKIMTATWPNYDEYTKRTDRVIPVVVLDRDPS